MKILSEQIIKNTKMGIILKKCLSHNPANNQNGSIIVVTLLILVTITLIGLMSSDTVVTENFIIRNQAIYKQNFSMVDAALMEGTQRVMNLFDDTSKENQDRREEMKLLTWKIERTTSTWATDLWYTPNSSSQILVPGTSLNINTSQILADRGESAAGRLRFTLIGFDPFGNGGTGGGSQSLSIGQSKNSNPTEFWEGRLRSEYVSNNAGYGMLRMEMGINRTLQKQTL